MAHGAFFPNYLLSTRLFGVVPIGLGNEDRTFPGTGLRHVASATMPPHAPFIGKNTGISV